MTCYAKQRSSSRTIYVADGKPSKLRNVVNLNMKSVLNCEPRPNYSDFAHLFLYQLYRLWHHGLVSSKSQKKTYCNTIIIIVIFLWIGFFKMLPFLYLFTSFKSNFNLNMYLCLTSFTFRVRYVWNDFIDYRKKNLIHAYVFDCRELWCCERRKKILWTSTGILGKRRLMTQIGEDWSTIWWRTHRLLGNYRCIKQRRWHWASP